MSLTSSDLELVFDDTNQLVGLRFAAAPIPQGASIQNAWIQFQVDETDSVATALTIRGQASDNALTFTTAAGNVSSRPTTAAAVGWIPPAWTTVGQAGPDQRTPNLSLVISEIVGRAGWASGNALAIVITGTGVRTAEAVNGGSPPVLHVEYTP